MDYKNEKLNQYACETKEKWGNTEKYKQFEERNSNISKKEMDKINHKLMNILAEIGTLKHLPVESENVQDKIKTLKGYLTNNYYECNNEILNSLGQMYVNDERFKKNIDKVGGEGTAEFVRQAISFYVSTQV